MSGVFLYFQTKLRHNILHNKANAGLNNYPQKHL